MQNCPTPKPQPMSKARRSVGARAIISHKAAKASGISGHKAIRLEGESGEGADEQRDQEIQ